MKKDKNKSLIVIIIVLAVIVAALAVLTGILVYNNSKSNNNNITTESVTQTGESNFVSNEVLNTMLESQPMYASEIKYMYANTSDQLEHDAISATVFNNSDVNISSFTIAFCAFDENGNPIKIEQPNEENKAAYIRTVSYDFANSTNDRKFIAPGESFDNVAIYVKNEPQIVTIKACVKSYVSTDNISWENPMYKTFKNNYSGKNLTYADTQNQ